ncbi:MAG: peroxiredoxin [Sandaracinaceae bacterium]
MRRLFLVLFLVGCGSSTAEPGTTEPATPEPQTETAESEMASETAETETDETETDETETDETAEPAAAPDERTLLTVGTAAPDFSAPDQTGEARTLAEHRGHPVVLYFYPRDATPGCTQEACAFRDAWDRLQAGGAVVYGVSTDDVEAHRAFVEAQGLPFSLLADPEQTILAAYGVPARGGYAARVTFLIDGEGVIRQVFPSVDPGVHADEVIAAIAALESR